MQIKLFHPGEYDGIEMVKRGVDHWAWRCKRCGRHGAAYSSPRYDLMENAKANHKCQIVETDNIK